MLFNAFILLKCTQELIKNIIDEVRPTNEDTFVIIVLVC